MAHKFDAVEFQAKMSSKATLAQAHTPPHAVPAVVARLDLVEIMIGVVGE